MKRGARIQSMTSKTASITPGTLNMKTLRKGPGPGGPGYDQDLGGPVSAVQAFGGPIFGGPAPGGPSNMSNAQSSA